MLRRQRSELAFLATWVEDLGCPYGRKVGESPAPVEPAAVPPAEEFVVDYVGPECWDSSYNVSLEHGGDTTDLRAAVQEDVDGAWVTLSTVSFYDGLAFVYSDHLDEGVSAT